MGSALDKDPAVLRLLDRLRARLGRDAFVVADHWEAESRAMTKSDKVLVILLRYLLGIPGVFALVGVFMSLSWMAAAHRWLGLGEMPTGSVVEYLARSVSAIYALLGALCLVMASDLERYRPLVRFFGVALALIGIVFTGVDVVAGMPWWWTASEGPPGVPVGALMFVLARPDHKPVKQAEAGPVVPRGGGGGA
jgi:hypothetical protein